MEITRRDTLGGYRIELYSKTEKEKALLIEIQQLFEEKDLKFLEHVKKKLTKSNKKNYPMDLCDCGNSKSVDAMTCRECYKKKHYAKQKDSEVTDGE